MKVAPIKGVQVTIEIVNAEATLLYEIADRKFTRLSVAKTYALALRSSEKIDWPAVNRAILKRWSLHALGWIKRLARSGKCFEETP